MVFLTFARAITQVNYKFSKSVINKILENIELKKLIAYKDISYLPILMTQVKTLLNQVERYIKIHDQCYRDFSKLDFNIGFVQSVTPHYPPNIFLIK